MDNTSTPREIVLVIGREPWFIEALTRELSTHGVGVIAFRDAGAAMRAAWEGQGEVLVADLTLPGVDGVAISRDLKSEPAPPKIVAIGTELTLGDLRRALRKEHRPDRALIASTPISTVAAEVLSLLRPERPAGSAPGISLELGFAGLLVALWRRSSTGVLELSATDSAGAKVRTTVYFMNGEPVFAEHGLLADSLGRSLLRTGVLTDAQLGRVMARMTERLVTNEAMRLGEVLIELGMLTPNQVHDALVAQVRQKLLSCFQWRTLEAGFTDRRGFLHEIGVFKCPVPPLLLEGLRRSYDAARLAPLLGPRMEKFPRLVNDLGTVASRFALGGPEQRFLRGITGARGLSRLQESSNLDRLGAGQLLAALLLGGELELYDSPSTGDLPPPEGSQDLPPAVFGEADGGAFVIAEYLRMKGKSDAEVLRVPRDATKEQIERAFESGADRFSPEATAGFAAELARKSSEIYALLRASRDRMLDADKRRRRPSAIPGPAATPVPRGDTTPPALRATPPPLRGTDQDSARDEPRGGPALRATPPPLRGTDQDSARDEPRAPDPQRRVLAEAAHQRGKQHLQESSLVRALEEFERANELLPGAPELRLMVEYTRYLLEGDTGRRAARDRARAQAELTISVDPKHAKAHAILGRFLRMEGKLEDAEKHLRLAMLLDKNDRLPETELRLLTKQLEERKKKRSR